VLTTLMTRAQADERWKSPAQALDLIAQYREAGVDQLIFNMPFVDDARTLEFIGAEIMPAAAKL
jgi:hypothetical protein